ncbi:hypothetical protein DFQ26_009006 [Actinomortierella ambigua]|nr:hypothetical protein DFQ26_009006 [Actinomortierella ambigua]
MHGILSPSSLAVTGSTSLGDHGSVFKARFKVTLRVYNVTEVEEAINSDIEHEIQALFDLHHNHILRFYEKTYYGGQLAIVTEDAEGGSLKRAIRLRRLDWGDKTRIANQIAQGLAYLHLREIVYRDLKSASVLLTKDGMTVKLCDFGMPTIKDMMASKSPRYHDARAVRWMAPELLKTSRPRYSSKSDIFAFGVLMWEMAANCTVPFKSQSDDKSIIEWVKVGGRETLPLDTPLNYQFWVEQCWDHDADKRPCATDIDIVVLEVNYGSNDGESFPPSNHSGITESCVLRLDIGTPAPLRTMHSSTGGLFHIDAPPSTRPTLASQSSTVLPSNGLANLLGVAERGDLDAQMEVASRFRDGSSGATKNDQLAFKWYRRAADQGNADAQYQLGELLNLGRVAGRSHIGAIPWYFKAANQGHASAQTALGWAYQYGRGVEVNEIESDYWYLKAAMQGHTKAHRILAGQNRRRVESISRCRLAAEQGSKNDQFSLGLMHMHGRGMEQDNLKAVQWFRKAAEQGHIDAQFNLGMMLKEGGQGIEENDEEAAAWLQKSATRGQSQSQYHLATMYEYGRGVEQNDRDAVIWYRKAADQGVSAAQFCLARMYKSGRGVVQSYQDAAIYYRKAAEQGVADAQFRLAEALERGCGVEENQVEALFWYKKAAGQGHLLAELNLDWLIFKLDGKVPPTAM